MLQATCFSNMVATTMVAMTPVGHTSEKATPSNSTRSTATLLQTELSTDVWQVHSLYRSSMQTYMCSNHNWLPLYIQTRETLGNGMHPSQFRFSCFAPQKLPHIRSCLKNTVLCCDLADKELKKKRRKKKSTMGKFSLKSYKQNTTVAHWQI